MAQGKALKWTLRAGFVLALALTLYFGARLTLNAVYWSNPEHQDQAIEGWMPLGYVGRSWDIPRAVMIEAAGIAADSRPRRSLEMIARDQGIPLSTLIARIETGIATHREQPDD